MKPPHPWLCACVILLSTLITAFALREGKIQAIGEMGVTPQGPHFAGSSSACSPGEEGGDAACGGAELLGDPPKPFSWGCSSPSRGPSPWQCLVVGAGPCGLRAAIELALLGACVVLLEKRDSFSRNNVLHLWPFTIHDLRALGAKKFYGRFCTGTLDHISESGGPRLPNPGVPPLWVAQGSGGAALSSSSPLPGIRQLQLILLKVALLLGVEVHINVQFKGLVPPVGKAGGQGKASLWGRWHPQGQGQGCKWPLGAPSPSAHPGYAFFGGMGYSTFVTVPLPAGGWRAVLQPGSSPLSNYEFDVLISAGGGKFVPEGDSSGSLHPHDHPEGLGGGSRLSRPAGFKRKETRGKLAIGITTNFINRHSRAEVEVAEISGVARIYNQKFFQNLYNKTGQWSRPWCRRCPGVPILPGATGDTSLGCPLCDGMHVPTWCPVAEDIWWLSPVQELPVALALPVAQLSPFPTTRH